MFEAHKYPHLGIMSTPLGGGYIIFAFFAVRCPMSGVRRPASDVRRHAWFPLIERKSIRAIVTKFGMQAYWVSSLLGIAFGCCTSFAY